MLLLLLFAGLLLLAPALGQADDARELQTGLSPGASIVSTSSAAPRWSDYDAPNPGIVVNVATEKDVQVTVKYCIKKDLPFLAQNGGNGWANTFHLDKRGILINLRVLNATTFSADRKQATIGGGAAAGEIISAAYANGVQIPTGGCSCIGTLGAYLGGGYGLLAGLHGLGIDNLLSLNMVLPDGSARTVTPKDTDLWWAVRGAGPNFGTVTSAVVKSYPVAPAQQMAFQGPLFFAPEKIEALVSAIDKLNVTPKMALLMYYVTSGPPAFTPTVFVNVFYYGSAAEGKEAFRSIFAVGPVQDLTAMVRYDHWNDGAAGFCTKGGRKPSYGAAHTRMVPATWRAVWDAYVAWLRNNGTGNSAIVMEDYSPAGVMAAGDASASFALRRFQYNSIAIPWYDDKALDQKANAFGARVRALLQASDGVPGNFSYINFAHGDESLEEVYGDSVPRLKKIKAAVDPKGRFNQWFPLS